MLCNIRRIVRMLNNKFRFVLLAVLALTLAVVPAVSSVRAQGASCLPGLDEATCTLFSEASANMGTVTKFVMDYTIDVTAPDTVVNIQGNGPIDVTELTGTAAGMMEGGTTDPTAALAGLTMQQTMTASVDAQGESQSGTFEFRIVDGVLYFTGDEATDGQWMKLDLAKAVAAAQEAGSNTGGMQVGGMDPAQAQAAAMQLMGALMTPEVAAAFSDPSKFIEAEVSDGGDVDGVSTQKITVNLKLGEVLGLLTGPDGAKIAEALAPVFGLTAENSAMITGMATMFKPVLDASTFSFSWWIDPEAKQFRGFGINIDVTVDAQTQMMMGSTEAAEDVQVKVDFLVTLSAIGEDVVVEPVADATEIDPAQLQGMAGMMPSMPGSN
jgi:hypothetical protein